MTLLQGAGFRYSAKSAPLNRRALDEFSDDWQYEG
jgi:hypothetical protein